METTSSKLQQVLCTHIGTLRHGWSLFAISLILLAASFNAREAYSFSIGVSGSLPLSRDASVVDFKVVFRDMTLTEVPANIDNIASYLEVYLKGDGSRVPFTSEEAELTALKYFVQRVNKEDPTPTSATSYTFTLNLQLVKNGKVFDDSPDNKLKVKIKYQGTEGEAELLRENFVYTEAPSFTEPAPILGTQKALTVNVIKKLELSNTTKAAKPAPVLYMYAFKADQPDFVLDLPAKIFDANNPEHAPTTCRLTAPAGTRGACIKCSGENAEKTNIYLDNAAITTANLPGLIQARIDNGSQGKITGLENEKKYFVFLVYDTSTKTSECLIGEPSINYTLTEINGEEEAKVVDLRCFIATATYGSPLAKELGVFRWYRDHILSKSFLGRQAVRVYYTVSPYLADIIRESTVLREWSQILLDKLAQQIKASFTSDMASDMTSDGIDMANYSSAH
jgi:hypothetical protein